MNKSRLHILHRQTLILYVVFLESSCNLEKMLGFFFHNTDDNILGLAFNLIEASSMFYFVYSYCQYLCSCFRNAGFETQVSEIFEIEVYYQILSFV